MIRKFRKTLAVFIISTLLISSLFTAVLIDNNIEQIKTYNTKLGETINEVPWPMYQNNDRHTGMSSYTTNNNDGREKWSFSTDTPVWSSTTIGADGTLYFGTEEGLYALHPNGTEKWRYEVDNTIVSTPAIGDDGTIYFGASDNYLYALNSDGELEWKFETGDHINSSPAIADDGTIYIGSFDGNLYAVYSNGTEKWNYSTGNIIYSSPAIGSDGTIYIGSWDSKLHAINPDGTKKWSFETGGDIWSSPSIDSNGIIYIGSTDNKLYAINPDGTEKWSFEASDLIRSTPAIGDDGAIYFGSKDNNIYAVNKDGSEKWHYSTNGEVSTPSISAEGTIYVGSADNYLYAIYTSGGLRWKFKTAHHIVNSPSIDSDGTVYIGSKDRHIYAVGGSSRTVPSKPENVDISSRYEKIELSWSSPSKDGGSDIINYKIYRGTSNDNLTLIKELDSTTINYTDKGLTNGQTYYYQISAVTEVGEGDRSTVISAKPEDTTPPTADAGEDRTVKVDEKITFDASDSLDNLEITSYEWDFDDGSTAAGESVDHRFDEKGTYEVTLTVTDEAGNTDTDTVTITVEKEDDGENRTPGFTILTLLFSITVITIYRYRKRL